MLGGANSGAMHERGLISVWPAGHEVSPGWNAVPRPPPPPRPPRPPRPAAVLALSCAEPAEALAARIIDAVTMQTEYLRMALPRENVSLNLAQERAGREWLEQLRTGDPLAFERIFRAYAASLCGFAFSYVRNREIAEEIVQDLFCWIWEQRFTIEMPHGMRPWLFTAVRNRSLNALRTLRVELSVRERLARDARLAPAVERPDAQLAARDLAEAAARVVATMPPRCRESYTLIRVEQMSYAEAARVMGISPKTVEIHMTRAMTLLRAGLAGWLAPWSSKQR
jgi:RNA polymerase sigma-70 factor (ECF subfamily)